MDRDAAVLKLLDKLSEVYRFIIQDDVLAQILSMCAILGKISHQVCECAQFISDYSYIKNFYECYKLLHYVPSQALTIITRDETQQEYCLGNDTYDPKLQ